MAATNFKTENNTFRKLIGNGLTYRIPRFQRDYSWDVEQWEDLWADILSVLSDEGESAHYMGYLVLQSEDDKQFDVIDGQQRLTTLSLIVLAILQNIQRQIEAGNDAADNVRRREQIRQTYIGYLDPVTLIARPKLTLNRNNNSYYQNHLIPLAHLPQRGLRASEHLLRRAFAWFDKQIANYLKSASGDEGKRLAQLMEHISDSLFFTVITVSDELNAYTVFETLNARGVRLSSTDLLKNYLFSILDRGHSENEHELHNLEERWENITTRLQGEKFPEYLRTHWNSRDKFTRQSELFKAIRGNIKTRENAFALIRGMEEDLDNYLSLTSPEISAWPPKDQEAARLLKMFRVRQPYPLLLAAARKFSPADFTTLLHAVTIISFRYNTIGAYSPNEQERAYNEAAEKIHNGSINQLPQLWDTLKHIYIDDQRFKADFAEKTIRTTDTRSKRIVRYILCALEKHLSGNEYDFLADSYNIEHILPQNAPDDWGGFRYDESNVLLYRLGNMTLLSSGENRELGTAPYAQKRAIYARSNFALTRKLAEDNAEWSPAHIAKWQQWMAKQASAIWRIDQLS